MSVTEILAGRGGGGRIGGGGSRPRPAPRPRSVPRPRTSTTRRTSAPSRPSTNRTTVNNSGNTVIHNHVYAPRVYGGRTYVYHGGGWGYGYYGPHPYFNSWYGYPVYYGNPVHWSGWDWPVALLIIGVLVAAAVLAVRAVRS